MKSRFLPSRATAVWLAAILAAFCAPPARAIRESSVLRLGDDFTLAAYHASSVNPHTLNHPGYLFDGDPTNGVSLSDDGDYLVADFRVDPEVNLMYVKEVTVGHGDTPRTYSLYTSEAESGSDWTAVDGAVRVRTSGTTTYPVARRAKRVKYVAETGASENALGELEIKGFVSTFPHKVSFEESASFHNADGSVNGNWSGGGTGMHTFFDGNFSGGAYIGPNGRAEDGAYLLLTLTNGPQSVFVTRIKTGCVSEHSYSVYVSEDGQSWTNVEDAVGVKYIGTLEFPANLSAKYVKCVFDEIGAWTASFAEIEVTGMDPDDTCHHEDCTAWAFNESETDRLGAPVDEKFCRTCGSRFVRKRYWDPPIGHDFRFVLFRGGGCTSKEEFPDARRFGSGTIACSRGDFRLDFPRSLDLVTNRVGGRPIGRVAIPGQVNFTDLSVTTTGNGADEPNPDENWGVSPDALYDDNWTFAWQKHWYSAKDRDPDPHVDYVFGTPIDLTEIELSVPNVGHTNLFFSVDDATGQETRLFGFRIERKDYATGDSWHRYPSNSVPPVVYDPDEDFKALAVVRDEGIPPYKTRPDGTHPMHQKVVEKELQWEDEEHTIPVMEPDGNDENQYQRFVLRFFETPVKHLRVRQEGLGGQMKLSELRPWGTVVGAGDLRYRKETLLLLR